MRFMIFAALLAANISAQVTSSPSVSVSSVQAPVFSGLLFYDTFARPDQTGLGTSTSGHVWVVTTQGGTGCQISGGKYTLVPDAASVACYGSITQGSKPVRLEGTFDYTAAGGTTPQWALISSADASETLQHMVHMGWSTTSLNLSTWNMGANMVPLAGCPASIPFLTPLLAGQTYHVGMTIVGNSVHVDMPDGQTFTCTDPLVSSLTGTLAIYEIIGSNATGSGKGEWLSARTYANAGPVMPNSSSVYYMPTVNPNFTGFLSVSGHNFLGNSGTGYNTVYLDSAGIVIYNSVGGVIGFITAGGISLYSGGYAMQSQKATTGTRYICIDTAGNLVSSTTACSGT